MAFVEKGIFAHAPSRIVFDLDGKWKNFSALGALQRAWRVAARLARCSALGALQRGGNSVVFVVKGDGKELFRSPLIQGENSAEVKLDVRGVKTLELISEDGGDGIGSDWSVWFEPKLSR